MSELIHTDFCTLLGIDHPIVQAPVGSASGPALAAAVSEAGGLGMIAGSWLDPASLAEAVRETRTLTNRPFAVNLVLEWDQSERFEAALEAGVPAISFSFGRPGPLADRAQEEGIPILQSISSAEEARKAADWADVLVAQGWEAGGHVEGTVSTLALVPAVVDAVPEVPVLGAGGVGDGRGVAALLALGAAGAWLGTRFVASEEATAHRAYKARITEAHETDTAYGVIFDGGWPDAPHRALRNRTVEAWERAGHPRTDRPGEHDEVAPGEVRRYDDVIPTVEVPVESVDDLALYAGQSAGVVQSVRPAGSIVRELVRESRRALEAAGAPIQSRA